jgi:hypothetical protein
MTGMSGVGDTGGGAGWWEKWGKAGPHKKSQSYHFTVTFDGKLA